MTLEGKNRIEQAKIYPPQFNRAICEGLREQIWLDAMGMLQIGEVKSTREPWNSKLKFNKKNSTNGANAMHEGHGDKYLCIVSI